MSQTPPAQPKSSISTIASLSRKTFNLPLLGTVSLSAVVVLFGVGYLLTRRKSQKFGIVKL